MGDWITPAICGLLALLLAGTAHAGIYRWVDEKGTVHFSDKPRSSQAEEVHIRGTGITVDMPAGATGDEAEAEPAVRATTPRERGNPGDQHRPISEADYRISSSVGKLGADYIKISGRISSGPKCEKMTVTATASNENGKSATIVDEISKPNSFGSTIFEGRARASGSADDYGVWTVDSVKISCGD